VRALDNLSPQVHGPDAGRPEYLNDDVELIVGDVRDTDAVKRALAGIDVVYHLAAGVGVGQSMYQIANYTSVNNLGTAVLLEALIERAAGGKGNGTGRHIGRHHNAGNNGNGDANGDGDGDGDGRPIE